MSATPITDDPYNFIPLLNLTSNKDIIEDPEEFTKKYLNKETLEFTEKGKSNFKEEIVGRISYLNRMKDIRQFTQPIIHNVNIPISEPEDLSKYLNEINNYEEILLGLKEIKLGDTKKQMINEIEEAYKKPIEDCDKLPKIVEKKSCISQLKKEIKLEKENAEEKAKIKVQEAKQTVVKTKEDIKIKKKEMKLAKKNDGSILSVLYKRCFKKEKGNNEDDDNVHKTSNKNSPKSGK
jgi:hypothetical protein